VEKGDWHSIRFTANASRYEYIVRTFLASLTWTLTWLASLALLLQLLLPALAPAAVAAAAAGYCSSQFSSKRNFSVFGISQVLVCSTQHSSLLCSQPGIQRVRHPVDCIKWIYCQLLNYYYHLFLSHSLSISRTIYYLHFYCYFCNLLALRFIRLPFPSVPFNLTFTAIRF